ncbi:unnamed protein product [Mesocestoides corti]|uniref:ZZ-type domain-containing protein n=1 Tax=Mesocestoides corti TaxID=53468 RepID=A0A158QSA2_MESCO|nr:unnamed protein product [Mesocestoides corti]
MAKELRQHEGGGLLLADATLYALSSLELGRLLEIFRELGLHATDPMATLHRQGTEQLLNSIYSAIAPLGAEKGGFCSEAAAQLMLAQAREIILGWLTYILDPTNCGHLPVSGLKVALSTLVVGKPADKFTYHYSLLVNNAGALQIDRLETYLHELLSLAVGVFEEPNFSYNAQTSKFLLSGSEPFFSFKTVQHPLKCEGCKREPIVGLRYKCTRCPRYSLCQDCFWTGITTDSHTNSHDVKEYTTATKTHSRQFGHSLRKSFQFGRQHSLPSGSSTPAQQVKATSRAPQLQQQTSLTTFPQYRMYRPGFPSPVIQPGFPPSYYYPVQGTFVRPPPTPVMQTRHFQRSTTIPRQQQQQAVLSPTFNSTSVQPISPQGTDPKSSTVLSTGVKRNSNNNLLQQQVSQRHHSVTQPLPQRQQLGGLLSQRQLSTDAEIGAAGTVATTPTTAVYGASAAETVGVEGTMSASMGIPDGTLGRKHLQQQPPVDGSLFRQAPSQTGVGKPDQHKLIANYPGRLATVGSATGQNIDEIVSSTQSQKELVAQLEAKNSRFERLFDVALFREILMEIQRLKMEQANQAAGIAAAMRDSGIKNASASLVQPPSQSCENEDPRLVAELNALRQRKSELEARMNDLQGNRRDLTIQLETLMRLLKTSPNQTAKQSEEVFGMPTTSYYQQNYYTRPRTATAALPRRSCSLIRRSSGTRTPLEVLVNEPRSLDAEFLLTSSTMPNDQPGSTMSLQRRGTNPLPVSPQHALGRPSGFGPSAIPPVDVTYKNRPRSISHSVGAASGALLKANSKTKPVISVKSQLRRSPLSGVGGTSLLAESDSEVAHASRRPFNCAAVFDPSGNSATPAATTSDTYLYSDPEMLSSGWQQGGANSGTRKDLVKPLTTTSTNQTSVVTVLSVSVVESPLTTTRTPSVETSEENVSKSNGVVKHLSFPFKSNFFFNY